MCILPRGLLAEKLMFLRAVSSSGAHGRVLRSVGVERIDQDIRVDDPRLNDIIVDVSPVKRAYASKMPERQFGLGLCGLGQCRVILW
jgi:hypothetical protein